MVCQTSICKHISVSHALCDHCFAVDDAEYLPNFGREG